MHFEKDINSKEMNIKILKIPMLNQISDTPGELSSEVKSLIKKQKKITDVFCKLNKKLLELIIIGATYKGVNPIKIFISLFFRLFVFVSGRVLASGLTYRQTIKAFSFAHSTGKESKRNSSVRFSDYSSGIGYNSENYDLYIARRYKSWHEGSLHFKTDEEKLGSWFYQAIDQSSEHLKNNKNIKNVVNFGSCYGIVENCLAKRFPNVQVYGVDRAPAVKKFNDATFTGNNLEFVASDIFDFLNKIGDLSDTHFLIMRTAFIFPELFIDELFEFLSKKNIYSVSIVEQFSYCEEIDDLYFFSKKYIKSMKYRASSYVHNYPYFCYKAGLTKQKISYLKPMKLENSHKDAQRGILLLASR